MFQVLLFSCLLATAFCAEGEDTESEISKRQSYFDPTNNYTYSFIDIYNAGQSLLNMARNGIFGVDLAHAAADLSALFKGFQQANYGNVTGSEVKSAIKEVMYNIGYGGISLYFDDDMNRDAGLLHYLLTMLDQELSYAYNYNYNNNWYYYTIPLKPRLGAMCLILDTIQSTAVHVVGGLSYVSYDEDGIFSRKRSEDEEETTAPETRDLPTGLSGRGRWTSGNLKKFMWQYNRYSDNYM
ncbi:uncharacterized protein LOC131940964 [Physella acuta]|uniref:uncharacterized protein LOC131940964 n=1 Tax=Physella acuta TaxID=109671 RepID=UPI0027DE7F47|nr:uncharacterized protein LOC131940964 [Physella acuta]